MKYKELAIDCENFLKANYCTNDLPCTCLWDSPENRFIDLYTSLSEIDKLHKYEKSFKNDLQNLEDIAGNETDFVDWLKKHEDLGTEIFMEFWTEWYEEEGNMLQPFIPHWQKLKIQLDASEWENTICFLKKFNQFYWTSGLAIINNDD